MAEWIFRIFWSARIPLYSNNFPTHFLQRGWDNRWGIRRQPDSDQKARNLRSRSDGDWTVPRKCSHLYTRAHKTCLSLCESAAQAPPHVLTCSRECSHECTRSYLVVCHLVCFHFLYSLPRAPRASNNRPYCSKFVCRLSAFCHFDLSGVSPGTAET